MTTAFCPPEESDWSEEKPHDPTTPIRNIPSPGHGGWAHKENWTQDLLGRVELSSLFTKEEALQDSTTCLSLNPQVGKRWLPSHFEHLDSSRPEAVLALFSYKSQEIAFKLL